MAKNTAYNTSIPHLSYTESNFYFVHADGPEAAVPVSLILVKTRIPKRFGMRIVSEAPGERAQPAQRGISFRPKT
jgi:hypothetical protein